MTRIKYAANAWTARHDAIAEAAGAIVDNEAAQRAAKIERLRKERLTRERDSHESEVKGAQHARRPARGA